MVVLEEAAFGGDTDCDVDGRCVAYVVVDSTLVRKFYAVLDLCNQFLDTIAWVPVVLHFVGINLAIDDADLTVGGQKIVKDLAETLVWIAAACFSEFVSVFAWY